MQTNECEKLPIGARMYAVHKKYPDENLKNGRIIVCRIKTFENRDDEIIPVLIEVGNNKREISTSSHYVYVKISDAIDAIRTTRTKK